MDLKRYVKDQYTCLVMPPDQTGIQFYLFDGVGDAMKPIAAGHLMRGTDFQSARDVRRVGEIPKALWPWMAFIATDATPQEE